MTKITIDIDDKLLKQAKQLTGITSKSTLINLGLKTLILSESSIRLLKFQGTQNKLNPVRRRKYV